MRKERVIKLYIEYKNNNIIMKTCKKCGMEKELNEFHKGAKMKDGHINKCKSCCKQYAKEHYNNNKDYHKEYNNNRKESTSLYNKEYREKNKDYLDYLGVKYRKENKKDLNDKSKKWYQENREYKLEWNKQYQINNKEKIQEYRINNKENKKLYSKRYTEKMKENVLYRLKCNLRKMIGNSITRNGYTKKTKSYEIIGCSFEEFLIHLNTNDYNFFYADGFCDIDHIIPLSTATTEEKVIELNHYTNLQLLPSYYNRHIKSDKPWDEQDFRKWLSENNI